MSDLENKNLQETERDASLVFNMGEEGKDNYGNSADSSQFKFVQQDASIHDTKFTTKPTTFFKDAMRRFAKNKSSVVGGIILGFLFLCALIIPMDFIPGDIEGINQYETNLPMKLFDAGTGWWDGTRLIKNVAYPYAVDENGKDILDENGNKIYIGEEDDPASIVKVENVRQDYGDYAAADGKGGYATAIKNPAENEEGYYFFSEPFDFNLTANKYNVTFKLGTWDDREGFATPDWSLIIYTSTGDIYDLTAPTKEYGPAEEKKEKAYVTPHADMTFSINEQMETAGISTAETGTKFSLGFSFTSNPDAKTAIYIQKFEITGTKNDGSPLNASQRSALRARSFGGSNSLIEDANELLLQKVKKDDGSANISYWKAAANGGTTCTEAFVTRCDITYDQYNIQYGISKNEQISMSELNKWINLGYIEYDYTAADAPSTFKITEKGQASGEVYVIEITGQTETISDKQGIIYTMTGTIIRYKKLGYKTMPIHLFGTEKDGKDMLKYVFSGLRTSLILGIIVAAINIIIGVIWGSISGYYGGTVDIVMERLTDILGGIPWIVLMTVLTLQLGQNFFVFALALCLTGWIGTSSTTRSQFYRYRGREYVLASRTLGARAPRLIFRHILPNAVGTIITRSILMIPGVIFSEATISYLGLGLQNLDSLGVILSDTQKNLSVYPNQLIIPAIIISMLMICFNLFGNGLRDAFNPSLKGQD